MKKIYLDHAAATPMRPEAIKAMLPYFENGYGNASSFHSVGKEAKDAMTTAREAIAKILNCRMTEIIFTSGGTESDNLALLGAARANSDKGKHIVVSAIEHPAVLEACKKLEKEGFEITYLSVDKEGIVKLDELGKVLREDTILVSVMCANNEIGTIQPIKEIAKVIRNKRQETRDRRQGTPVVEPAGSLRGYARDKDGGVPATPYFHTDACQAAGALDLDVVKLGVDMLTLSGSKIYGPKGIGVLYVKKGIKVEPLVFGGGQERGLRSGTENIPAIVGLAATLELAQKERDKENQRLAGLRDYFIEGILKSIKSSRLNGSAAKRLPNNINVYIPKVEGEAMVLYLDSKGIYASTGSACHSTSLKPSHVLLAIGMRPEQVHGSLRFTLGKSTGKDDIDYTLKVLPGIAKKLSEISSL